MEFTKEEEARFLSKIDYRGEHECWIWKAGRLKSGYGYFSARKGRRKTWPAHRVAWMMVHKQDIPLGFVIHHICATPSCVNPEHLKLATFQENNLETVRMGRGNRRTGSDCPWAKLTEADVLEIRSSEAPQRSLAGKFGVDQSLISQIRSGKRWGHL